MKIKGANCSQYTRVLCLFVLLGAAQIVFAEKVVLQLKWEHEFQFAGYYSAHWQGYYQDNNLDVEIRSAVTADQEKLSPIEEVISGRADFGIGDLDILKAIDNGEELLILAPIYQSAPTAIVTLEHLKIKTINDLIGLKVGMVDTSAENVETYSMYRFHGVNPQSIILFEQTPLVKDLVNGQLDAIITYGVSAEYQAKELGVKINLVDTAKFGSHFFGDVLFTRKSLYLKNKKMVKQFLDSSLKGWKYALNHKIEVADRISNELPRHLIRYEDLQGYNRFFAEYINHYIKWPEIDLGYLDVYRWNKIYNDLKYIGVFENDWGLEDFIVKDYVFNYTSWLVNTLVVIAIFLVLVLLILYQQTSMYRYLMIFVIVTMSFAYYFFEKNLKAEYQQQLKFETLVELEAIKSNLVGLINGNISLLKGFATHISYNPDITQDEFQKFAEQVFQYGNALINFAAAPDLVVKMIYPLKGNEGVIGLDYTKNSAQIDAVLDTTYSRDVIVAGPQNLIQGGDAIIARVAIFENNNDDKFWGIISAPIDLKLTLSLAGVFKNDLLSEIAIKKIGSDEKMIHGKQSIFLDEQAVKVKLAVGDTEWSLFARPAIGWSYSPLKIWLWRLCPLTTMLIFFYFLYIRNKQREKNKAYQVALKRNERLLLEVGELANVGGWRVGPLGNFTQWTAVSKAVLGEHFPSRILHINDFIQLFPEQEGEKISNAFYGAIMEGMPFDIEVKYQNHAGQFRWIRLISDEIEKAFRGFEVTGAIQDITYYKNVNELIEYQATHDTLTGLYNRYFMHEEAAQLLNRAAQNNYRLMALFIDIDDFKNVNDSMGHQAGDLFLKSVAGVLKSQLAEQHLLARYSGDEFVAIISFEHEIEMMPLIQRTLDSVRSEYQIHDKKMICSCSVGAAFYPEHSDSIEDLVAKADMAMYSAKQKGKNGFEIYSSVLSERAERKAILKTSLQHALLSEAFEVYFQPVINLADGRIEKFEALVRWFDDEGAQYNTEEFISLAEEAGLVVDLDLLVLKKLNQHLCFFKDNPNHQFDVSINVSPIMFNSPEKTLNLWINELSALNEYGQVTIEITERTLMNNPQNALLILNSLDQRGIHVAIDDFGVGYSSLNYLTKFPIQIIKIDKSFTNQIGQDDKTDALIKSILSLAAELKMRVVAEGIEKSSQYKFLLKHQCQFGQGYYFSPAIPFKQACEMAKNNLTENCQIKRIIVQQ